MDSKPHWRLVVAIEYKNSLSPAQIEAKYGISKNNMYTWLDRFEERGIDVALHDTPKPGCEPKLTDVSFPEIWLRLVDVLWGRRSRASSFS